MGSLVAIAALFLVGLLILNVFKNAGLQRNSDTKRSGNTYFFNEFNSDSYLPQNGDIDSGNQDNDPKDCGCDGGGSDSCDSGCDSGNSSTD